MSPRPALAALADACRAHRERLDAIVTACETALYGPVAA